MKAATALRDLIESCELSHPAFVEHECALARRLDDAMAGRPPASEWVVGPSRVGKSMLINTLARRYPEMREDGVRRVPLVVVSVPSPVTPKEMPRGVISSLGIPSARGNSGDLFDRMKRLLELAQTRAILFEEASHIVEIGTRLPPRAAGDWFKSLMDRLGITIILFGVPRLERLYASNEQLRQRSQARREFRPYDYMDPEERKHFAACVQTYADMFSSVGLRFSVHFEGLVQHCYLLSGGLVGVLSAFMNRLAFDLEPQSKTLISFEDCASSLAKVEAAGSPACPAFVRVSVTPVELNQAYAHVMRDAGLPMRRPE